MLVAAKKDYLRKRPCKWFVTIVFMIIGTIFLKGFTIMITMATNSLYDREAIESLMRDMIGRRNITEIITDELMVVTYEYNSQTPRLYTKHFATEYPTLGQITFSNATGGSSAAPGYFTP